MSAPNFDQIGQVIKSFKTSSAAVPSLVLVGLVTPVSLWGATEVAAPLNLILAGIAALPVILAVSQITLFSIFDRDRLQNEEHVENKMIIGRLGPLIGDSKNIVSLENDTVLSDNPLQIEKK